MNSHQVLLFEVRAGTLSMLNEKTGGPEGWTFAYEPLYLASDNPIALSASLPLREAPFVGAVVRNWFCNLLPEGAVREAVERRLRIPLREDFALLAAIGGECAGAISVNASGSQNVLPEIEGEDLEDIIARSEITSTNAPWALAAIPRRLSLAGAQDKVAVIVDGGGRLRLPRGGEPSTHILKPESLGISGLRDLEALGLALARALNLNAAEAHPRMVGGNRALLVKRFDRVMTGGRPVRLHQEDFCQALGYPGELKYQSQGGPSLQRISELLLTLGLGPKANDGFLDWVLFNVLIGNGDAHAKNLALLVDRAGRRSLAPYYDLVPTFAVPSVVLELEPALAIGQARRIDAVTLEDIREFARSAGFGAPFAVRRLKSLAEAMRAKLPGVVDALVAEGCDRVVLDRAGNLIVENGKRLWE